jgi:hypothetical protein
MANAGPGARSSSVICRVNICNAVCAATAFADMNQILTFLGALI